MGSVARPMSEQTQEMLKSNGSSHFQKVWKITLVQISREKHKFFGGLLKVSSKCWLWQLKKAQEIKTAHLNR
eukprot:c4432_g1_i1 orf=16-231(-)